MEISSDDQIGVEPKIVIIGAGPTGLGAAWRLNELGHKNWVLIDESDHAGGLASSVLDENGFTWDLGGHVLFSHYQYFDRLMEQALGDAWLEHIREAWVWIRNRWIPYPFQNNIWRLPEDDLEICLKGLVEVNRQPIQPKPETFREWLAQVFGDGLCETFMYPYNFKVWAHPPDSMDADWMGERVAAVDLARVLQNLVHRRDDAGWGPNATFRFPQRGGTGAIWTSLCSRLPQERIRFGNRVVAVTPDSRQIQLKNGETIDYNYLISTTPLDCLLRMLKGQPELSAQSPEFVHSSTHIVGIGLDGKVPDDLATKCWMYFPESTVPFYRVTVFSNYSQFNVAIPGRQWSLMAEISESPGKPVNSNSVIDDTIQGFRVCGLLNPENSIVSTWRKRLEYGYPTPWYGRGPILQHVNAALTSYKIFSRGRFGAWKYEVSNQDHSVMQGVETVNYLINGTEERTYFGDMSDS